MKPHLRSAAARDDANEKADGALRALCRKDCLATAAIPQLLLSRAATAGAAVVGTSASGRQRVCRARSRQWG